MIAPMNIRGDRVKELREAHGWTQKDLERESGIAQSTLSRIERGASHGSYTTTMVTLAKTFGCAEGYLMGEVDAPTPDIQTIASSDAAPTLGGKPEAQSAADEVVRDAPELAAAAERVLSSGSIQALDIPLTPAALEALARVVQRHSIRRRR